MKIAVPTKENNQVDNHFGHCVFYTIYTVENNEVTTKDTLPSPQGCGCKSGIVNVLHQMGVNVMPAGSMGAGALNVLSSNGIEVVRGCSGDIDELVTAYLAGGIADSGIGCAAHEDGHECHHHE